MEKDYSIQEINEFYKILYPDKKDYPESSSFEEFIIKNWGNNPLLNITNNQGMEYSTTTNLNKE